MSTYRFLHITEAANLSSILTHGLRLTRPRLEHHRRAWRKCGLPSKVLYAWKPKTPQRAAKIAKDVAYWHVWGWRSNDIVAQFPNTQRYRTRQAIARKRPLVIDTTFVALTFTVPRKHVYTGDRHKVLSSDAAAYDLFDPARNHVEPLYLVTKPVPPDSIRVWATLWTLSDWDPIDGWTTRGFCRRGA